jgi:CubicO group peptidase (beta-lactamase class C family)
MPVSEMDLQRPDRLRGTTRGRRGAVAVAVVCGLLVACTGGPPEPERSSPVADGAADAVADAVEAYLDRPWLSDVVGVVVLQGGDTVVELYPGGDPDAFVNTQSVTKSVVGALVGAALADGSIEGVDATLAELLPAYAPTMTPEAAATTLDELLTMTAGVSLQQSDTPLGPQDDWVAAALATIQRPSGGRFVYSNEAAHLVAAVVREATGEPVLSYARRVLLDPLGIPSTPAAEPVIGPETVEAYEVADFAWPTDPQGLHLGSGLLKMRTADLARVGQLHLDGGRYGGRQVLPKAWVRDATSRHVDATGGTGGYGYLWWVDDESEDSSYSAIGYAGQRIEVVPERDVVIAISTSWPLDAEDEAPVGDAEAEGLVEVVLDALPAEG